MFARALDSRARHTQGLPNTAGRSKKPSKPSSGQSGQLHHPSGHAENGHATRAELVPWSKKWLVE